LDFNFVYMARKLRHRPKTFMGVQDSIMLFGSPNLSNNGEVRICPTVQILAQGFVEKTFVSFFSIYFISMNNNE
jgi:hypothetical protein